MSLRQKVLITGITGQIGQYVRELFERDGGYEIMGISRHPTADPKIVQLHLTNLIELEHFILDIFTPDIIIHLAGISNLEECAECPSYATHVNGDVTVNICSIIATHNLPCRFFNASSSEIYKGHINYVAEEDDRFYKPNHPYGISKLLAHNFVDYYRDVHHMPFSNGIIFTTESKRRPNTFLLKKIANHIKRWSEGHREPITVGCLKSHRTLLHAYDVATAIKKIVEQPNGANYLICGEEHLCVEEIVRRMFIAANIEVAIRDDGIYCAGTNELIVRIQGSMRGAITSIHGNCRRLKEIGWTQTFSVDEICRDHLS